MTKPEWQNDPDMQRIDKALNDLNGGLAECQAVLNKPGLVNEKKAHVYVHMGVLYYRKNDLVNANKMWDEALRINPNERDAKYSINKAKMYR